MKILLVNKYHYLKGGSEKYYFKLAELLKEHGHEVAFFSMKNEKNIMTGDKEYFVDEIDLNAGNKLKVFDVIFSKNNKRLMEKALDEFKPDIVHINNFQRQLSASIIYPIKKRNIPIVFTAHDVQAICPAITMLDKNKNICEKCMNGKYTNCLKKKCNKNSTLKSLIGMIEGYYYRLSKIYLKKIDAIITPTEFYKKKLIEDGINKNKIYAIHNFINLDEYEVKKEDKGYALYIGRLSQEKGVNNLLKAFKEIQNGKLYIAGDGPEKENIKKYIEENNMTNQIMFLGFLNKSEVIDKIRKARMIIVPSIWYENCPYSVLEALAIGKPVIGANIAGIAELVENNKCGLLYKYDNPKDLTDKIKRLFKDNKLAEKYGNNAKKFAFKKFDPNDYYKKLLKIYLLLKK